LSCYTCVWVINFTFCMYSHIECYYNYYTTTHEEPELS